MLLANQVTAGVDEVGRGSLFGPVFAGAVILNQFQGTYLRNKGLKDSKVLSPKSREKLAPLIKEKAEGWGLGQSSANEIDKFGIRKATELAMIRALQKLPLTPELVLIDGILELRLWKGQQKTLIRGDSKNHAIAAASVLAKEERDNLIKRLAIKFPAFGLENNVGYGTNFHRRALLTVGPTVLHRQTFLSKILNIRATT